MINLLPILDGSGGEDRDPLLRLMRMAANDIGDPAAARHAIEGVRLNVAIFDKMLQDRSYSLGWSGHPSAENWLIKDALPKIYVQHFGRPFRMSRAKSTELPTGPGIRFIIEVLSIKKVFTRDGKSYGPEAIEYWRLEMPRPPGRGGHDGQFPKQLLTVDQLADLWQISPRTIRRMIKNGQIRVIRIGRSVRIHPKVAALDKD